MHRHSAGHHVPIESQSDLRFYSGTDNFVTDFVRAQSYSLCFVLKRRFWKLCFITATWYYIYWFHKNYLHFQVKSNNFIQTKNITSYISLQFLHECYLLCCIFSKSCSINAPSIKNHEIFNVYTVHCTLYRAPHIWICSQFSYFYSLQLISMYQRCISIDGAWLFFFLLYFFLTSSFLILSLIFFSFTVLRGFQTNFHWFRSGAVHVQYVVCISIWIHC